MSTTATRGRGRPAGSRTIGPDAREGLASGRHPMPKVTEVAMMAAIESFESFFPCLFHGLREDEIERLERRLGRKIDEALKRLEG